MTPDPGAHAIELTAGAISARFEPATLMLRYLAHEGREVLRGVYPAVRDRDWGTVAPVVDELTHDATGNGFALRYRARCLDPGRGIDFRWRGRLEGDARGWLRYAVEGEARSDFERNRIGFCVLHPAELAGRPCTVVHGDGRREAGRFPEWISPHQPFLDIAAVHHEVGPGVEARVDLEGDVFEMEDQRNWTDASFKTYCTPLERPFPVRIAAGERVRQRITVHFAGSSTASSTASSTGPRASSPARRAGEIEVRVGTDAFALPRLGVARASHGAPLERAEAARLRALRLAHLRADLDLAREPRADPEAELEAAAAEAAQLGAALELVLHVDPAHPEALDALAAGARGLPLARVVVLERGRKVAGEELIVAARRALDPLGAPLVSGTDAFFTELNRERFGARALAALDGVCYSLNPQVHASDATSLRETLTAQGVTVRSARRFAPDATVHVTPVTLKMRSNPNATSGGGDERESGGGAGADPSRPERELPERVDVRQLSCFAAGWTLGSVRDLAAGGAASVTYFETTGWLGVMERAAGSPAPAAFPSTPGMVFPLYHVLADIGEWAADAGKEAEGARALEVVGGAPFEVQGLVLARGARRRVLLANLSGEPRRVRLVGAGPARLRLRRLDAAARTLATTEPEAFRSGEREVASLGGALELPPHAYLCGDGEVGA